MENYSKDFRLIWPTTDNVLTLCMPFKPNEVESLLQSKFGFTPSSHKSKDHKWYELQLPDLPVITTKVSHSREEIDDSLLGKMGRQCRVRAPFFKDMLSCDNDRDAYYQKVKEDPFPPWDHRIIT